MVLDIVIFWSSIFLAATTNSGYLTLSSFLTADELRKALTISKGGRRLVEALAQDVLDLPPYRFLAIPLNKLFKILCIFSRINSDHLVPRPCGQFVLVVQEVPVVICCPFKTWTSFRDLTLVCGDGEVAEGLEAQIFPVDFEGLHVIEVSKPDVGAFLWEGQRVDEGAVHDVDGNYLLFVSQGNYLSEL